MKPTTHNLLKQFSKKKKRKPRKRVATRQQRKIMHGIAPWGTTHIGAHGLGYFKYGRHGFLYRYSKVSDSWVKSDVDKKELISLKDYVLYES